MVNTYDTYILVSKVTKMRDSLMKMGVELIELDEMVTIARRVHEQAEQLALDQLSGKVVYMTGNMAIVNKMTLEQLERSITHDS